MNQLTAARTRIDQASDLPSLLTAAFSAFQDMLTVIRCHEECDDAAFAAFILSAAAAANGRDRIAAAPSLPREAAIISQAPETDGVMAEPRVAEVALALAGLSDLLASRLAAATSAAGPGDREACLHAARHATRIGALLGRAREP